MSSVSPVLVAHVTHDEGLKQKTRENFNEMKDNCMLPDYCEVCAGKEDVKKRLEWMATSFFAKQDCVLMTISKAGAAV